MKNVSIASPSGVSEGTEAFPFNRPMDVLVGCEWSGRVRDAFNLLGHNAVSCDLLESPMPGPHIVGDVLEVARSRDWDMLIAFPPCTYLSSSGLHWNKRRPERAQLTEEALAFVRELFALRIKRKALENPVGCISTRIKPYTQIIQPHQFGADASKTTCLWLENLPPLRPTWHVRPRIVDGKKRWANQTDSGQNRLPPSANRGQQRGETYAGVAAAMALQWGGDCR